MNLNGARILLTGATGGIGSALAKRLERAGATLLRHGCSSRTLEDTSYIQANLADDDDLDRLVEVGVAFEIDVLINCAGINQFSGFEEADIDRMISTNVTGPMKLTQRLLPHLKSRGEAVILNVGSTFGAIGYPGYVAYCAAKHAIKGFSEGLSRELSDSGIKVLYFSPRATSTDMNSTAASDLNIELGVDSDSPREVARQIVSALVRDKNRLQMGGTERVQVKVNSLFPPLVDSAIAKQLPVIREHLKLTEQES